MVRRIHTLPACLLLALALPTLGAPPLADPTRPPGAAMAASDGTTSHAPRRAATAPSAASPATAASAPEVQSLHLPRQGAPSALVDGRLVRVGDRLAMPGGDRTVIAIDAQGIVLQAEGRARAPQRLWLLAGVVKQPLEAAPTRPPHTAVAGRNEP